MALRTTDPLRPPIHRHARERLLDGDLDVAGDGAVVVGAAAAGGRAADGGDCGVADAVAPQERRQAVGGTLGARAGEFPDKPVRMIVAA